MRQFRQGIINALSIRNGFEVEPFFTKDKTVWNKAQERFFYHIGGFLLIVQTDFRCFHRKLPALYFQDGNPAFLQQIIFKALAFFRQMILIILRVRGHRDCVLAFTEYWISCKRWICSEIVRISSYSSNRKFFPNGRRP